MTSSEQLTSRPIRIATDGPGIYELTASVAATVPHVVDLPYRLASPSAHLSDATQLWEDEAGELVAWAILQFPWLSVDYAVRPDYRAKGFEDEVLTWAIEGLTVETAQRGQRLHFFVSARPDDHARIAAIERAEFVRQEWGYVGLERDLSHPLPDPELPPGFVIRPLDDAAEVGAYVQVHRGGVRQNRHDGELAAGDVDRSALSARA